MSPVGWCMPRFPALGKLRQKGYEFKACIVYIVRLSQKQNKKETLWWHTLKGAGTDGS